MKRRHKVIAAIFVAAAVGTVFAASVGKARADVYPSGYCLEDPGDNGANGIQQDIYTCLSGNHANERWSFHYYTDHSFYMELASHPGECLDLNGDNGSNGHKYDIWTCNGSDAQRFIAQAGDGVTDHIEPIDWDTCVEVNGGQYFNDAPVDNWTCETNHPNEDWWFEGYGNTGQYFVEPSGSGTITGPNQPPTPTPTTTTPTPTVYNASPYEVQSGSK